MPRFTTSLLLRLLVILGLLSASCRGTSIPAYDLSTAASQNQGPVLDKHLGPGSAPGGRYPGGPPRTPDKKNDNYVPEPPDGDAAATPAATKASVAHCTSACNAAASGTTSSGNSQTQGPVSNESAGQSARLSWTAAGMALPLLMLLLHLLA